MVIGEDRTTRTSLEKKRFDMNAEPVAFLQFMQWQIRKVMGSPMISYFIDLHKQDPVRSVEKDILIYFTGSAWCA